MTDEPQPRTVPEIEAADLERQRGTAVALLAQFVAQINAHDEHVALGRAARRAAIRRGAFDVTILERIDGLREGRETWSKRLADINAAINAAIAKTHPEPWEPCLGCGGTGIATFRPPTMTYQHPCPACNGTGKEPR